MFDWYPHYEYLLACIQLLCFMLGMGATLSPADFIQIILRPKILLIGLGYQMLFVPLMAVAINHLGDLEAGIAIGLVLVSLMPGGTVSKVFTHLGRGNVALSIALSVFSTLACVFTVPLLLGVLARDYIPQDFQMPLGQIVADVAIYLVSPLLLGMVLARQLPEYRKSLSRWCVRLGWGFVILMVVGSLGSGRIHPGEYGWKVPLAIILFCVASQQASMLPFYFFRWPRPDRLAVGIEVTMRNMNLALLLKALLFPAERGVDAIADGVLFVILYYAAVAMFAGFPLAMNHLRLARRAAARRLEEESSKP